MRWHESDGVRWLEAELPGARVAFTTRTGGVSEGAFESLNLGILTGDDPGAVSENRRRLAVALGLSAENVAFALQVHGAELTVHGHAKEEECPRWLDSAPPGDETSSRPAMLEADGHVVTESGLAALVFVADCLPVALAGPSGVAILHCGWRGLAAGIVARGVAAVGATDAAIGPGIGPCCYEVGAGVHSAFASLGDGVTAGRSLDLAEVARRQLRETGVDAIESANLCTGCEEALFFSHRRDAGRTGRQAGLIWMDGGEGLSR